MDKKENWEDREFVLTAVRKNGRDQKFASKNLRKDFFRLDMAPGVFEANLDPSPPTRNIFCETDYPSMVSRHRSFRRSSIESIRSSLRSR